MRDDRLTLFMSADNLYPIIEWEDEHGTRVAAIVAHEFSNPAADGSQFRHAHMSIYSSDAEGNTHGIVDIPWGWDESVGAARRQVQLEADLIMKGQYDLIIREGNEFFRLRVGRREDGTPYLWPEQVGSDRIIPASVPV